MSKESADAMKLADKSASRLTSPNRLWNHHRSCPQLGQGASPAGSDGSMQTAWPQIGHAFGRPSGVRDEIVMERGSRFKIESYTVSDFR